MPASRADQLRTDLRRIGARRKELRRREAILMLDTERALKRAQGVIPVNEAAKLVELGRATVYQNYLSTPNGQAR